jgi:hypothetical protein
MPGESIKDRDLRLYGVAFRYKTMDGAEHWLDPRIITVYQLNSETEGVLYEPPAPGRFKRLVKWMLSPGRISLGVFFALFLAFIANGRHGVSWPQFGWSYLSWIVSCFIWFWIYEAYHWAGGKRPSD